MSLNDTIAMETRKEWSVVHRDGICIEPEAEGSTAGWGTSKEGRRGLKGVFKAECWEGGRGTEGRAVARANTLSRVQQANCFPCSRVSSSGDRKYSDLKGSPKGCHSHTEHDREPETLGRRV